MLNGIWSILILAGLLWGAVSGNLDEVTRGLIDSSQEAVTLGLSLLGIMAFWCGVLEIGERAGLVGWLAEKMGPVLDFLFPELPRGHPARRPIAVNLIANMLGLGAAATPAGLEAMKLMRKKSSGKASNSMCTFLILNVSSLQLVPVTLLAYRSQYGSENPEAVLGPAFLATLCSTAAAVVFCKLADALTLRQEVRK